MNLETTRKKGTIEGAISALRKAPEDDEGKVVVAKAGLISILEEGLDAVKDLENLEERVMQESKESQ